MERIYKELFFALCLLFSASEASAQWGSIEALVLTPQAPSDRDLIGVQVQGLKGDPCQIVSSQVVINDDAILIDTTISANPAAICPAVVVPLDFTQLIGSLTPGQYRVTSKVNGALSGPELSFEVAAASPSLTLSPPTGSYASNQSFDFTMLLVRVVNSVGTNVVSGSAFLSGQNTGSGQRTDVSDALAQCLTQAQLTNGGLAYRCTNIASLIGLGSHTLTVNLQLEDGTQLSETVLWTVLGTQQ